MAEGTHQSFSHPLSDLAAVSTGDRKHVIVAGAGAVGLASALWLLKAGHDVTVCDPNPPLDGVDYRRAASYGNACSIALSACLPVSMPGLALDVPQMLLNRESPLSIYWQDLPGLSGWLIEFLKAGSPGRVREIVASLGNLLRHAEAGLIPLINASGASHLVRRTGCLYLYSTEQTFQKAGSGFELRRQQGVNMRVLDQHQIREREPALAPLYAKGVEFLDAFSLLSPAQCMKHFAKSIQERGGRFIQEPLVGIQGAGSGIAARLASGNPISADRLVVACGAWSGKLANALGDKIPLNTERGYHVMYPAAGNLLSAPTCYPEHGFYMTPMADGLRCAGTVELGGLDKPARAVRTQVIDRVTQRLLPAVGKSGETWLGFRPSMPDSLPVIGPSNRNPRVIYAFGHGHVGLTLAGITGRLVCEVISGLRPSLNLDAFKPDRFCPLPG